MPPPDRSDAARPLRATRRANLVVAIIVGAVLLLLTRNCFRSAPVTPEPAREQPPKTAGPPSAIRTAESRDRPEAAPGSTEPPAGTDPHRMRAMTFAIDASGVRLADAVTTAGRVKAPPLSQAPHRIEFEAYDESGRKIYAGAFDHPLHRGVEHADAQGKLAHSEQRGTSGAFQIRLPATLNAARLAVFEVRPEANGAASRTELAALALP